MWWQISNHRIDEDGRATLRRFVVLGVATPLAGLGGGDDGEDDSSGSSDARDAIVGYVASALGAYFSKVHDDLQLGTDEIQYHLRSLADDGTLEVSRDGDYKRFLPVDRFSEFEQVTLDYLRRDTPCGVFVHLLCDSMATGSEFAARLGVSRATASAYIKGLDAVGLLSHEDGYVVRNPEAVVTLLIRYADSFGSNAAALVDNVADPIRFDPRPGRESILALLRRFGTRTFSGGAGTRKKTEKTGTERRGVGDDGVPCVMARGRTRRGACWRRRMAEAK